MQKTFFRVSIKALVVKNGKILLVQEPDGRWELPGGGLEHNETIKQAIKRELKEEIGVGVAKIADRPLYVWTQTVIKKNEKINRLFLGYVVKLKAGKFKTTNEAVDHQYFSKAELNKINLHINLKPFKKLFDPKDFK